MGKTCYCRSDSDCVQHIGNHSRCDELVGECWCASGWAGWDCNTFATIGPPVMADGEPCAYGKEKDKGFQCCSAVDAVTHTCCGSGEILGADSRCCPVALLDGCGVCNGTGVALDGAGVCCYTAVAADGKCCDDAHPLDSCGVCGGANECAAVVRIYLPFPSEYVAMGLSAGESTQ